MSLYESITGKAQELAGKMNEEVRTALLEASQERAAAKVASVELTKKFLEEKAAFEAEVTSRADSLIDEVRVCAV